jgi:hypothetical protein
VLYPGEIEFAAQAAKWHPGRRHLEGLQDLAQGYGMTPNWGCDANDRSGYPQHRDRWHSATRPKPMSQSPMARSR